MAQSLAGMMSRLATEQTTTTTTTTIPNPTVSSSLNSTLSMAIHPSGEELPSRTVVPLSALLMLLSL